MATSAMCTTFTLNRRRILPGSGRQKHIDDSCKIRRYPAIKHKDLALPNADNSLEPNLAFLKLKDAKKKTETVLGQRRKDLIAVVQTTVKNWDDLENCEKKLRKYFIYFSKFIKESFEKRERFLDSCNHHREMARLRTAQVEILRLQLERCKIVRQLLNLETRKHSIYAAYLQRVVEESVRHSSIRDLINRFEVILESLERTTENYHDMAKQHEGNQKKMEVLASTKRPILLDLGLQLICLSKKYDDIWRKNKDNESLIMDICKKVHESALDYEECLGNIDSLYNLVCRRLNVERKFPKKDFENQLSFMKSVLAGKRRRKLNP